MYTYYIVCDSLSNGFKDITLDIVSIIAIISAILVIISKNPVISILFLIGLFLSIAVYLVTIGINFIGLSYLLVYIGAISILFLFILMLINIRMSELLTDTRNSIVLAVILGISFNNIASQILPYSINIRNNSISIPNRPIDINYDTIGTNSYTMNIYNYPKNDLSNVNFNNINYTSFENTNFFNKNEVMFVVSKAWDKNLAEVDHITSIGNILYTSYSIWLIITSVILLLAMVGTIVITIKQKD